MANFSQLRRRQSSREMIFRSQFSVESPEDGDEIAPMGAAATGAAHHRFPSRGANRHSLRRQISEAPDPDEIGEAMWEMRPRYATSAGELKRKIKKEKLAERERKEVSSTLYLLLRWLRNKLPNSCSKGHEIESRLGDLLCISVSGLFLV